MVTGIFRTPKPDELRNAVTLVPYIICIVILGIAIVIANENANGEFRGTLGWLSRQGMDVHALGVYIALTAGVVAILWHRARRHWLSSILLLFVAIAPYLFYTSAATYYLSTEPVSSGVAIVIYWGGYIFGLLLITLTSTLLTWLEVTRLKGMG